MKLTDTQLRRLRPKERVELRDGNGLILRASPAGGRRWSVVYRFGGKRRRVDVGSYPDVSLADARARLVEIKQEIAAGRDPATPHFDSLTIAELYKTWREREAEPRMTRGTLRGVSSTFDVHVLPHWSDKEAAVLRAKDLAVLLARSAERRGKVGGPGAARNVKAYVGTMIRWACAQGLLEANRFAGVRAPYKYIERDRAPSVDEMRAIFKAAGEMGWPYGPYFQMLVLTGVRRGELANAEWSWLDSDALVIPKQAMKIKTQMHTVPLTDHMRERFDSCPRLHGSQLIFTMFGRVPIADFHGKMARLRELAGIHDFTLHDFRRGMATEMDRLEVEPHIVEFCLAHIPPKIQRVYRKYQYFDQKLAALQKWNDALVKDV